MFSEKPAEIDGVV